MDTALPGLAGFVAHCIFRSVWILATICIINPWLMIPVSLGLLLIYHYKLIGTPATVDCQRQDNVIRAPVHSTFAMLVNGLVTLRVHDKIGFFKKDFIRNVDKGANMTFSFCVSTRWMGIRFDCICALFAASTAIFAVSLRNTMSTELLAISLSIVIEMMNMFSSGIRLYTEA